MSCSVPQTGAQPCAEVSAPVGLASSPRGRGATEGPRAGTQAGLPEEARPSQARGTGSPLPHSHGHATRVLAVTPVVHRGRPRKLVPRRGAGLMADQTPGFSSTEPCQTSSVSPEPL